MNLFSHSCLLPVVIRPLSSSTASVFSAVPEVFPTVMAQVPTKMTGKEKKLKSAYLHITQEKK